MMTEATFPQLGAAEAASIDEALLAFQARAGELTLVKDARSNFNEYLTLDGLVAEVRPLLTACGIVYRQTPGFTIVNDAVETTLTTVLHHPSSRTFIEATMLLREVKKDPQGQGSAITYARRYMLMAMLGLVADVDDDAAKATTTRKQAKNAGTISAKQRRDLMTAMRQHGLPTDRALAIVKDVAGVEKSEDIPADKFADVLEAFKAAA